MARSYSQVLETMITNFISHNAQLVAQNEMLLEQNMELQRQLNAYASPANPIAQSGGQLFNFEKAFSGAGPKQESEQTGTD